MLHKHCSRKMPPRCPPRVNCSIGQRNKQLEGGSPFQWPVSLDQFPLWPNASRDLRRFNPDHLQSAPRPAPEMCCRYREKQCHEEERVPLVPSFGGGSCSIPPCNVCCSIPAATLQQCGEDVVEASTMARGLKCTSPRMTVCRRARVSYCCCLPCHHR